LNYFLILTKNNEEFLYIKLRKYYKSQTLEDRDKYLKECKSFLKHLEKEKDFPHKFVSKYLEKCEKASKFKFECLTEKGIISQAEVEPYNTSIYDCYKNGYMKGLANWIESENSKHFDYSNKKLNLLKFRSYLEMKKPEAIDNQLAKTSLKKFGLTPIMQVKESEYFTYAVDILESMDKNKEALELIISDKNYQSKLDMVNNILRKQPNLQKLVDELCAKYKVNLQ
jgi:hypothetical protein